MDITLRRSSTVLHTISREKPNGVRASMAASIRLSPTCINIMPEEGDWESKVEKVERNRGDGEGEGGEKEYSHGSQTAVAAAYLPRSPSPSHGRPGHREKSSSSLSLPLHPLVSRDFDMRLVTRTNEREGNL